MKVAIARPINNGMKNETLRICESLHLPCVFATGIELMGIRTVQTVHGLFLLSLDYRRKVIHILDTSYTPILWMPLRRGPSTGWLYVPRHVRSRKVARKRELKPAIIKNGENKLACLPCPTAMRVLEMPGR